MTMNTHAVHPNVAAERLGLPISTIYERIRNGELDAKKHGNSWIVLLPADPASELPLSPFPDAAPSTARNTEDHDVAIHDIRIRLATLESEVRALTAAAAARPAPIQPGPVDCVLPTRQRSSLRMPTIRPRFLALSAIVGLTLSGIGIQSSPAQRSDDLTVALVFACGAITGSIAAWLALEKQLAPDVDVTHSETVRKGQRIEPDPHLLDRVI